MANGLKIASMNVRGLAGEGKRRDIFNWLKRKQFTIYCLQDIHINSKNESFLKIGMEKHIFPLYLPKVEVLPFSLKRI